MIGLTSINTAVHWIGRLASLATLGILLAGIWRGTRRPAGRTSGRASGWLRSPVFYAFSTALFVGVSVALWRPVALLASPQALAWMLALGLLAYFPGIGLVLSGRLALGRMFFVSTSLGSQLYADHKLVTHGPLTFVRHPMYLGLILAALGSLLIYRTWTTAANTIFVPLVLFRARREEQALAAEFGGEWEEYAARTGFLYTLSGRGRE